MIIPDPQQPLSQQMKSDNAEEAVFHSNLLIFETMLTRLNLTGLVLTFLSTLMLVALFYLRVITNYAFTFGGSYGFITLITLVFIVLALFNSLHSIYPAKWIFHNSRLADSQVSYDRIIHQKIASIRSSLTLFSIASFLLALMLMITLFESSPR